MSEQTETTMTDNRTEQTAEQRLQEAVNTASDILVVARDQKNTAIALVNAPIDEVVGVQAFIKRVNLQISSTKAVSALSLAKAKERNAGRPARKPAAKKAEGAAPGAGVKK